jgi:hypothetical protein
MRKKLPWQPEELDTETMRVKVIGGWLVCIANECGLTSTFIADPNHEWTIKPPVVEEKAAYDASDFELRFYACDEKHDAAYDASDFEPKA